jgi:hypothetical protein
MFCEGAIGFSTEYNQGLREIFVSKLVLIPTCKKDVFLSGTKLLMTKDNGLNDQIGSKDN